ncbi:hypothetical protein F5Y04DRAFT_186070 [Hypomontagnella monticulosa]|nr:hypothetical protein F5Y04DRAFT_186070 [Hypomontagnella monticulosa]
MSTASRTESPSQSSQPTEGGQSKSEMDIFESPPSSVTNDSAWSDRGRPIPIFDAASSRPADVPRSTQNSYKRPLFPDGVMPLRLNTSTDTTNTTFKDTPDISSAIDDLISGKRNFQFESMAAMIEAHVEELKKRPPLGATEGSSSIGDEKHDDDEAGSHEGDFEAGEKPRLKQ